MDYSKKLKDPRWQRLRLEVMKRDDFKCTRCGDAKSTLHVNHLKYTGDPWEAPMEHLETLCESCHKWRTDINLKFQLTKSSRMPWLVENGMETDGMADSVMKAIYDCMVLSGEARAKKSMSANGKSSFEIQKTIDYNSGMACRLVMDGLAPAWAKGGSVDSAAMATFRNDTDAGRECSLKHLFFCNSIMSHEELVRGIAAVLGIEFDRSKYLNVLESQ